MEDIKELINKFLEGRKPEERDASFDYCYNYFYSFYKENKLAELSNDKNIEISCLQLGFYLASWGMLRGKSPLLQKSVKHFEKLIIEISKMPLKLWEIDVNNYNEENIKLLLNCKQKIIEVLGNKSFYPSDTLVTKIMLGVFANIPAFDTYFINGMKFISVNVNQVNEKSLRKIKEFYDKNKEEFDSLKINTLDFFTGQATEIIYTKSKLFDMYGFMVGENGNNK